MMRGLKRCILLTLLILSAVMPVTPKHALAYQGKVKVYIICLSNVGGWSFPNKIINTQKVADGAIYALSPLEDLNVPYVHPKYGKEPPFYYVDYVVVTDWSFYKSIVESYNEVVILNTHGEILPIPSGYSAADWIDKIADAMLNRHVTWVHTAGYPFYYAWYQGASDKTLVGEDGFKRLMSHINKGDVTCWPPSGEDFELVRLNQYAGGELLSGGFSHLFYAYNVWFGRPLKASDFNEYLIMPIHGGGDYYVSAAISFAKPGQKFDPSQRKGFGAYIHVGTYQTFTDDGTPTNADYMRGYIGAAATVQVEMQAFNPTGMYASTNWADYAIHTRPVISSFSYNVQQAEVKVKLSFPVYGWSRSSASGPHIQQVLLETDKVSPYASVQLMVNYSRTGKNTGLTTFTGLHGDNSPPILETILFFGTLPFIPGELAAVATVSSGAKLWSDWFILSTIGSGESGVLFPSSYVKTRLYPELTSYQMDGLYYEEFEYIFTIELTVNLNSLSQWRIIPLHYRIAIITAEAGLTVWAAGELSIAIYSVIVKSGEEAYPTIFFEDFEDGLDGWQVGDGNSGSSQDYWGIWDYNNPSGNIPKFVWCAYVGNNSINNDVPNWKVGYDKDMNAYMDHQVDLKPYKRAALIYSFAAYIKSGDYFYVEYHSLSGWVVGKSYTDCFIIEGIDNITLPNTADVIRFRFVSNGDNDIAGGVFIFDIEIRGELPNDADKGVDAGDTLSNATAISYLTDSQVVYEGYLGTQTPKDWYSLNFDNAVLGKELIVDLYYAKEVKFVVTLVDPNNATRAISSSEASCVIDLTGAWKIGISNRTGFGPYKFTISIYSPSSGGCPILYVWNGEFYAYEGLLNIHNPDGVDVIYNHTLTNMPELVNGTYLFRLVEHPQTHSYIDQVKLYAILTDGGIIKLPLIYACHSEYGNVLPQLLLSDDWKTETLGANWNNGVSQSITLKFAALPPNIKAKAFIFQIEGNNPIAKT